jgi:hypothetical protein
MALRELRAGPIRGARLRPVSVVRLVLVTVPLRVMVSPSLGMAGVTLLTEIRALLEPVPLRAVDVDEAVARLAGPWVAVSAADGLVAADGCEGAADAGVALAGSAPANVGRAARRSAVARRLQRFVLFGPTVPLGPGGA